MHVRAGRPAIEGSPHTGLIVPALEGDHTVQFYEGDDALAATVAGFLADGLALGQPLLVIATAPHREAICARLAEPGIAGSGGRDGGGETGATGATGAAGDRRLLMLDAHDILDAIMVDGMPDEERFTTFVADVAERHLGAHPGVHGRIFGELVDLLWMDGRADGALRLEQLWNELGERLDFALLCAYSMDRFAGVDHAEGFRAVCSEHRHVLPTERYTRASDAERLIEISMLQQRARALETELARRVELDARLRAALAEHDHLLQEERAARSEAERTRAAAQEASRAKSAFLSMMSHELRTPLNAIGGYSELIAMGVYGPVAESQRDALARVQRSQQHLLGVIDQVLDYAQVDSGTLSYAISDLAIHEVLSAAESLVSAQMHERRVTCTTSAPAGAAIVALADREKVTLILRNVLANAAQSTHPGGQVVMECGADDATVHVRVRDTGVGIPAAQLEFIFEAFVQGESSLTRERGGVGLGLAMSRGLARGMGGDLRVESEVGTGSTFTLTLPRAPAAASSVSSAAAGLDAEARPATITAAER